MNKCYFMIVIYIFSFSIGFGQSFNDNFTVPNEFSSGDTISSSQINENFKTISDEINSLKKFVYSNNIIIGEFLSFYNSHIMMKNSYGYYIKINLEGNIQGGDKSMEYFYYTTNNCTGDKYLFANNKLNNQIHGLSVNSQSDPEYPGTIMYTNSYAENVNYQSSKSSNSTCSNSSGNGFLIKVYENNPTITGVNSFTYNTPITIR